MHTTPPDDELLELELLELELELDEDELLELDDDEPLELELLELDDDELEMLLLDEAAPLEAVAGVPDEEVDEDEDDELEEEEDANVEEAEVDDEELLDAAVLPLDDADETEEVEVAVPELVMPLDPELDAAVTVGPIAGGTKTPKRPRLVIEAEMASLPPKGNERRFAQSASPPVADSE